MDGTPANGQAYQAYLEKALEVLANLTSIEYYQTSLPSTTDQALAEIVSAFTAWPAPKRERFIESFPGDRRALFGIFGHRAATLAVRRAEAEWLRLGLVGNVIANFQIPPNRNLDSAFVVYYHCARKLGIDPVTLFDEAAEYATDDLAAFMKTFSRRKDVTLKQFGWREVKTQEGVRYKFDW
jgi:hypothetical protein